MGKLESMRDDLPKGEHLRRSAAERRDHRLRQQPRSDRRSAGPSGGRRYEDALPADAHALAVPRRRSARRSSKDAKHIFIVENSYTGQLERLIRVVVGPLEHMHAVRKYNGKPFRPIEIIEPIERCALVHRAARGSRS